MPQPLPGLTSIEDRTYAFALALIQAYRKSSPRDQAERIIWTQLLRSGTSAGANSAESRGAQSRPDWVTRRYIALKEMREALFWLRLYQDANPASREDLVNLIDEANQLISILTVIVARERAKKNGKRG